MTDLVISRRSFIDGRWCPGEGGELNVESPATGEPVATIDAASVSQVESAIVAARRAFDQGPWPGLPSEDRIDAVLRMAVALEARRGALIETVIRETGCPRGVSEAVQVDLALRSIRELADLYGRMPAWEHNEVPLGQHLVGSSLRLSVRRYEPAGVVAAITPYNFPFMTNIWKVVPALLAGCTTILRPNPLTLEATVLGEAADAAELPPGVLNVVVEAGDEGGVLLSRHRDVDVVSFTGSTAVGRMIAAQAAGTLKRVVLELGGKSVQLHLPDFLDDGVGAVVPAALAVFVAHAGQGCAAADPDARSRGRPARGPGRRGGGGVVAQGRRPFGA